MNNRAASLVGRPRWERWFAWYPVVDCCRFDGRYIRYDKPWRWFWLRWVERRFLGTTVDMNGGWDHWEYRELSRENRSR